MKHIVEVISAAFISREQAHREHLKTRSYSAHVALGEFYDGVIDLVDEFAEVAMGIYGGLPDVPYKAAKAGKIDNALEAHLECIEDQRCCFDKPCDSPLLNILDEIAALYNKTLYKLRRLS